MVLLPVNVVWLVVVIGVDSFFISLFTQTYLTSQVYLRETILNGLTFLRFIITLAITLFFFFPKGFDFGLRQNGSRVMNVEVPHWAKGSTRLFMLIHRQVGLIAL